MYSGLRQFQIILPRNDQGRFLSSVTFIRTFSDNRDGGDSTTHFSFREIHFQKSKILNPKCMSNSYL